MKFTRQDLRAPLKIDILAYAGIHKLMKISGAGLSSGLLLHSISFIPGVVTRCDENQITV
jgi:hypothetical protein